MEYDKIQIDYAKRSIENYKKVKNSVEHEFTFLTGTLLSVLSALLPERETKIISFEQNSSELPYYDGNIFKDYEDYLYDIRNALAHKVNGNFMDFTIEKKIEQIQLNTDKNRKLRFEFKDLIIILDYIEGLL